MTLCPEPTLIKLIGLEGPRWLGQSLNVIMQQGSCIIYLSVYFFIYLIILYWSEGICNESSIIAFSYALPRVEESPL